MIKRLSWACVVMLAMFPGVSAAEEGTVPLTSIVADVAKRTGMKFLVDPRVRADVLLIGDQPSSVKYPDLLTILQTHGFTAVKGDRYVRIVPDATVRQAALPLFSGEGKHDPAEYVNRVIAVKSIPATQLVPILRPLLPQHAHLAAMPCTNFLLMVDSAANVRRIEQIVGAMDTGEPYKPQRCKEPDRRAPSPPPLPPAPREGPK